MSEIAASVAAVVVHYETPERLAACVQALRRQTRAPEEVVVVDNSVPSTVAGPAEGEAWRLDRAGENLGFAAACNRGAANTDSRYLLFLNADLLACAEACERLAAFAEAHARVAVVGPQIIAADGSIELSARSFPSLWSGVVGRSTLVTRLLRRAGAAPRSVARSLHGESGTVDWVSGACMLVRRSAFTEVGGFDEGLWMYWEDADLCRRLKDRGWNTALCVEARARHETGSSGTSERTIRAFHDSAARYYARHLAHGGLDATLARWLLALRMRLLIGRRSRREAPRNA